MMCGKNTLGSKGLVALMWNEYDSFVINGFSTLYQNDDLADVTLICEGRSFKAHRVILSVWSSYFREIFISNPTPHPIVILRQTSSEDFELILRFMYQGKILVPQDDADRFLKTADNFKIAGLSKMKVQNHSEIPVDSSTEFVSARTLSEVDPLTTFINMTPNCPNIINLKNTPIAGDDSFIETTEVTIANTAVTPSISKSLLTPRTSVSVASAQSSPVESVTVTKSSPGTSTSVKPFPIFQRQQQKYQSTQAHQTVIGSTTIRQIENYSSDQKKGSRCGNGISPSDEVITFDSKKVKAETKPVVESVMVLQNFIHTNTDVQTLVDPSRDDQSVSESIFNSIYNPIGGGPKQKMIQIQNQSDGSIIGYTFIPDDQGVTEMEEQNQTLSESPMSSSSHSHQSEIQYPEVIDLDVDDSVHSPVHILPTASSTEATVPVTTFSVTHTNSKPVTKRRSKKRKGENEEASDGEEDNKDVEERVACPTCAKIVKKTSLKVHMKRSHLEEGVVLLCPICGKQVSSKGVYYKHMYMHRRKSEFPSEDDRMDDFDEDM